MAMMYSPRAWSKPAAKARSLPEIPTQFHYCDSAVDSGDLAQHGEGLVAGAVVY